jgi:hypothetical protein
VSGVNTTAGKTSTLVIGNLTITCPGGAASTTTVGGEGGVPTVSGGTTGTVLLKSSKLIPGKAGACAVYGTSTVRPIIATFGGDTLLGFGGRTGVYNQTANGANGTGYGSGGGGAYSSTNSAGAGAAGFISIKTIG